jgi:hypothetical protein
VTPMDAFVARENIVRMRTQLTISQDATTQATLRKLLKEQRELLRVAQAKEHSKPD